MRHNIGHCSMQVVALHWLNYTTQGVLAFEFPISILMQIKGQYGCQIFRKIVKNYVPISDFATRSLNLRKPQKFQIFCKKIFIFFAKKRKL